MCGKPFTIFPCEIKHGSGHCCSHPCRNRRIGKLCQKDLVQSFWEKVNKTDGCWLWTGSISSGGYGAMCRKRKSIVASRFSWEIHRGAIPDGLWVLHHCDNPACVRPDHLFLGNVRDNVNDCKKKMRHAHGEKMGAAKLTESQVVSIRSDYARNISCKSLSQKYGVSTGTIHAILSGRTWRHLLTTQ